MAPVAFSDEKTALKQALQIYRQGTYDVVRLVKTERDDDTGRERHTTIFDTSVQEAKAKAPASGTSLLSVVLIAVAAVVLGVALAVGLAVFHR